MSEPGVKTIDVSPDGMLLAAYNIMAALLDSGKMTVDYEGEFMIELFQEMCKNAALIDKSSWLPHNREVKESAE